MSHSYSICLRWSKYSVLRVIPAALNARWWKVYLKKSKDFVSCCSSSSSPRYFLAPVSRNMIGRGSVLKEAPPEQTVDTDCRMKATGLLLWRWPLTSCEKILQSKIGAELVELSICFPVRLWVTFVSGRLRKLTSDILHSDISSSYILCNLQQAVGLPLGPLSNISGKPVKGGMSGASLCVCVCVCVCVL